MFPSFHAYGGGPSAPSATPTTTPTSPSVCSEISWLRQMSCADTPLGSLQDPNDLLFDERPKKGSVPLRHLGTQRSCGENRIQ